MMREIDKPKVALIGRPNVGKSTLYNRLVGRRQAIVDEKPGITRDRLYGQSEWNGYEFTVIDCGGIGPESEDVLWEPVAENSRVAMEEADIVLLVVDGRAGVTGLAERAGIAGHPVASWQSGLHLQLLDAEGFLAEDDARIGELARLNDVAQVTVIGTYAAPMTETKP